MLSHVLHGHVYINMGCAQPYECLHYILSLQVLVWIWGLSIQQSSKVSRLLGNVALRHRNIHFCDDVWYPWIVTTEAQKRCTYLAVASCIMDDKMSCITSATFALLFCCSAITVLQQLGVSATFSVLFLCY